MSIRENLLGHCAQSAGELMIQVCEQLDPTLEDELIEYLSSAPQDSGVCVEHDPRWLDVLEGALRHRPIVLVARGDNGSSTIKGYLPMALVASRLFGRFLVSLPYLNRAGIVANDPRTAAELIDSAIGLAETKQVQYVELRHHTRAIDHQKLDFQRDEKQRMVLPLPDDPEALWQSISAKVRNQIRKGDKSNLSIHWASGSCELLRDFYAVFATNMRDLGTPVYPRKLFELILDRFGTQAEICVVEHQQRAIAGALLVHDGVIGATAQNKTTQVPSASSLRQYNKTNANMWMYHQLLRRAIERGSNEFDFGRSSEGSGTYRFKKQWGAQPEPTVWQYHVRYGDVDRMRPECAHNARRIEMWKRLPVWVTRLVGPSIVGGIP